MRADGVVPSTIAKTLKIGRATIYRALRSEPLLIAAREELPAPEGGGKILGKACFFWAPHMCEVLAADRDDVCLWG
jgi:hypothetical protein